MKPSDNLQPKYEESVGHKLLEHLKSQIKIWIAKHNKYLFHSLDLANNVEISPQHM